MGPTTEPREPPPREPTPDWRAEDEAWGAMGGAGEMREGEGAGADAATGAGTPPGGGGGGEGSVPLRPPGLGGHRGGRPADGRAGVRRGPAGRPRGGVRPMTDWTCWQFVGAGAGVCLAVGPLLYPLACLAAWLGYL